MAIAKVEMEIIGQEINAAVIRFPSRSYPGVLVQGDSLHNILSLVQASEAALVAGDIHEVKNTLDEVRKLIEGYDEVYRRALAENGLDLPF